MQISGAGAAWHALREAALTAGMILLVAMIGAIVLTHRQRGDTRGQNVSKQIARRPQDATINLKPEVGKGVQL